MICLTMDGHGHVSLAVVGDGTTSVARFLRLAEAVRNTHQIHGGDGVGRGIRLVTGQPMAASLENEEVIT